jgi:hypothetical protein
MVPTPQSATIRRAPVGAGNFWTRLAAGFVAGFLAVLIFSSSAIAVLHTAALFPMPGWSLMPVPPFGVPQSLVSGFWGGLWGVAYALLEPRLTKRLGWWSGGLVFGVLPLAVFLFVVPALKGMPIGPGLVPSMVVLFVFLHAVFGLGTAIFFRLGLHLVGRKPGRSPDLQSGRSQP